nr:LysR substrate-binding domain-containing protein [Cupriavidus oxalaticus]
MTTPAPARWRSAASRAACRRSPVPSAQSGRSPPASAAPRRTAPAPAGHPLAGKEVIRPQDLAGESFVSHPRVLDSRLQIDALFASYGIECKVQVETQVSWSICAFVEEGLGVALIDPITAHEYKGAGVCFRMFEPLLTTDFSVLFSAQRSPSILLKAFVTHTRAFALARLDPRFVVA